MTLNILAVDDEAAILELVRSSLSTEGHHVVTASSLRQARGHLDCENFDLLIVDIGLSDGNGLDLVQKVRSDFSGWIIVLTGRGDVTDRVVGLEVGADDYIVKPFHVRELRARVRAVQRRLPDRGDDAQTGGAIRRQFCSYVIDAAKRSVTTENGDELHLTTKEFDVLWALIEHRDEVVTREAIVAAAFGKGHEVGGRPVDGLVSRLREKLFPDGSGHLRIKTIHGRGYLITQ